MSTDTQNESSSNEQPDIEGIDFFPERRGDKIQRTWFQMLFMGENKDNLQRIKCERRVARVMSENSLLKFMKDAIKSTGCDVNLNRHICCEPCSKVVTGGYDPELNQIVVCQNTAVSDRAVTGSLAHEMVHMFDFCRANLDFKNLDHLICTEIRAANLMHCSFMSAMFMGSASLMRIKKQHRECVKNKALSSVMAVRNVTIEEAEESFRRVFKKCYEDLEPLGQRLRRNSDIPDRIYRERYHYGYGHS